MTVRKIIITLLLLLTSMVVKPQYLSNPSFEGPRGSNYIPSGWTFCHILSTPDTGPGVNGDNKNPSDGNSFLNMVVRGGLGPYAHTTEDVISYLTQPLLAGVCYDFKIDLAFAPQFGHDSWDYGWISYDTAAALKIYGHVTDCGDSVLLAETGPVTNTTWQTFEFTLEPEQDIHFLRFKSAYITTPDYFGNIQLDNIHLTEIKINDTLIMETTVNYGESINLYATSGEQYIWGDQPGLSCYDCQNPIATPPYTIEYSVNVVSTPSCYSHFEYFIIHVEPFIPNLITPNGDGKNDLFDIKGLEPNSSITITDRWGKTLYQTDNYKNDWDGTYKDQLLPTETYWYLIKSPTGNKVYKGFILIKY
jgi:gliding motility-associated-like protein